MKQPDLPYATADNLPSKKTVEEGIKIIDALLNSNAHKTLSFKDLKKYFFECFTTIPVMMNLQFPLPPNIYRTRLYSDVEDNRIAVNFSYPNPNVCIKPGRAHLAGYPVFYGSLYADVAAIESGSVVGDRIYLSKWKIKESAQLNSFQFLYNPEINFGNQWKDINESAIAKYNDNSQYYPQDTQDAMKMLCTKISQLFTSQDYAISSFLRHYYLYDFPKTEPRADVILYPSMRTLDDGINFAFSPGFVDENFILEEVQDITIVELSKEGLRFNLNYRGLPDNNKCINWYKPKLKKDEIAMIGVTFVGDASEPVTINSETDVYSWGRKTSFDEIVLQIVNNENNHVDYELLKNVTYDTIMIPQEYNFQFHLPDNSCEIVLNEKKHALKSLAVMIKYHIELVK